MRRHRRGGENGEAPKVALLGFGRQHTPSQDVWLEEEEALAFSRQECQLVGTCTKKGEEEWGGEKVKPWGDTDERGKA